MTPLIVLAHHSSLISYLWSCCLHATWGLHTTYLATSYPSNNIHGEMAVYNERSFLMCVQILCKTYRCRYGGNNVHDVVKKKTFISKVDRQPSDTQSKRYSNYFWNSHSKASAQHPSECGNMVLRISVMLDWKIEYWSKAIQTKESNQQAPTIFKPIQVSA